MKNVGLILGIFFLGLSAFFLVKGGAATLIFTFPLIVMGLGCLWTSLLLKQTTKKTPRKSDSDSKGDHFKVISQSASTSMQISELPESSHIHSLSKAQNSKVQINLSKRELCPDGNCIGVIGSDGKCKECGKSKDFILEKREGAIVKPSVLVECESCKKKISVRAMKCPQCGYEKIEKSACNICNKLIPRNSKSCPECGDPNPFHEQITSYSKTTKANNAQNGDIFSSGLVDNKPTIKIVKRRLWVRFWARTLDAPLLILMGGLLIGFWEVILGYGGYSLIPQFRIIVTVAVAIVIEAISLTSWGTTPGKWLLGTSVSNVNGGNLSFGQALKRTPYVWSVGRLLEIPGLNLLASGVWGIWVGTGKNVPWDKHCNSKIEHKSIKSWAVITYIVVFLIIGYIIKQTILYLIQEMLLNGQ